MNFDYQQWEQRFSVQEFVQNVFDQENIFASHEIEYLKNNCSRYPKIKNRELDEFQELMNQIDFDEVREKTKEKLDKTDDWTSRKTKITGNLFSKTWDSSGMYEKQDGVGMFESEEDMEYMIKYLDKNE